MAVLRGEQARQAYARAQHHREPAQPSNQDDGALPKSDTITSGRSDTLSAPRRARAKWAQRWTYQYSHRGSECP
jgi:hypothetical protein